MTFVFSLMNLFKSAVNSCFEFANSISLLKFCNSLEIMISPFCASGVGGSAKDSSIHMETCKLPSTRPYSEGSMIAGIKNREKKNTPTMMSHDSGNFRLTSVFATYNTLLRKLKHSANKPTRSVLPRTEVDGSYDVLQKLACNGEYFLEIIFDINSWGSFLRIHLSYPC